MSDSDDEIKKLVIVKEKQGKKQGKQNKQTSADKKRNNKRKRGSDDESNDEKDETKLILTLNCVSAASDTKAAASKQATVSIYTPRIAPAPPIAHILDLCNPKSHASSLRRLSAAFQSTLARGLRQALCHADTSENDVCCTAAPSWHASYAVCSLYACRHLINLVKRGTIYNRIANYKTSVHMGGDFSLKRGAGDVLNLLLFSLDEYDFGDYRQYGRDGRPSNRVMIDNLLRDIIAAASQKKRRHEHPFVSHFLRSDVLGGLGLILAGILDEFGICTVRLKTAALAARRALCTLSEYAMEDRGIIVTEDDSDHSSGETVPGTDSGCIAIAQLLHVAVRKAERETRARKKNICRRVAVRRRQREKIENGGNSSGPSHQEPSKQSSGCAILNTAVMNHALSLLGEGEGGMEVFLSSVYPKKLKDFLFYFRKSYIHHRVSSDDEGSEDDNDNDSENGLHSNLTEDAKWARSYHILVCLYLFFFNAVTTQLPSLGSLSPLYRAAWQITHTQFSQMTGVKSLEKYLLYHMERLVEFRRVIITEYYSRQFLEPIADRLKKLNVAIGSTEDQSNTFYRYFDPNLMNQCIHDVLEKQRHKMLQQVEWVQQEPRLASLWTGPPPTPLTDHLSPFFSVVAPIIAAKMSGNNNTNNFHILAASPPPRPLSPKSSALNGQDFLQQLIERVNGYEPEQKPPTGDDRLPVDISSINFNKFISKKVKAAQGKSKESNAENNEESSSLDASRITDVTLSGSAPRSDLSVPPLPSNHYKENDDIERFLQLFLSKAVTEAEAPPAKYFDFFALPTHEEKGKSRASSLNPSVCGTVEIVSPSKVLMGDEKLNSFEAWLADFDVTSSGALGKGKGKGKAAAPYVAMSSSSSLFDEDEEENDG